MTGTRRTTDELPLVMPRSVRAAKPLPPQQGHRIDRERMARDLAAVEASGDRLDVTGTGLAVGGGGGHAVCSGHGLHGEGCNMPEAVQAWMAGARDLLALDLGEAG